MASTPVVSPRSGRVFEKSRIVAYLATNQNDPFTNSPLTQEELVPITTDGAVVPPKPPSFQSIPAMLASFQNEFDAMALEIFSLRKQLSQAKQELSASLYQYDAAVRVAAGAVRERDEAKRALQELVVGLGEAGEAEAEKADEMDEQPETKEKEVDQEDASETVPALVEAERVRLFSLHKQKHTASDFALLQVSSVPIKKYNHYAYHDQKVAINSGKTLVVHDLASGQETAISHAGGVIAVDFTELNNQIVPVYATKKQVKYHDKTHKFDQVVDVKSHPTIKSLVAVICKDSWTLLHNEQQVFQVPVESAATAAFHVDGALLGIATSSTIDIYNVADGTKAASLACESVSKLVFGLNGYWLAALTASSVQVFDLRNQTCIHTIAGTFSDVCFDRSTSFVVTCADGKVDVHKYTKKGKVWADFHHQLSLEAAHLVVDGTRCVSLGPTLAVYDVLLSA